MIRTLIANLGLILYFAAAVFFVFVYVPSFFVKNIAVEPELSLRYLAVSGVVIALFWIAVTASQSMMNRLSMILASVAVLAAVTFYLNAVTYEDTATSELIARGHWAVCVLGGFWAAFQYSKLRKAEIPEDDD